MTITEKILAAHAGRESVGAGEFIYADVDIALGNDITAPIAIEQLAAAGISRVWDASRVVLVPDHFTPNKDIKSAEQVKILRDFAAGQGICHWWDQGKVGIEHALLPEQGVVGPGDLVIGADSHTCTYGALGAFASGVGSTDLAAIMATGKVWLRVPESIRFEFTGSLGDWVGGKDLILFTIGKIGVDGALYRAMEFCGHVVESLPMDDRFALCNMAVEAGAKNGIIPPDDITKAYAKGRCERPAVYYESDSDAEYVEEFSWDVSGLGPQIACPNLPENVKPVEETTEVRLDQVVIGSCTNGRLSDLAMAAHILKGRQVADGVRCLIFPATPTILREALKAGYLETFLDAGAVVSPPTCGPCLGGHMGILAAGEVALATTNRNFTGRMGHPKSEVYLCNPAVAAASAVTGRITHPAEVVESPPKA
ncbi:MAG: 3-isopropylmalate dehydratase large subunit [Phycisphaerae bacterium]|jgi:3-isopropylmalate/(R)-2-methylmalate dehydratase large subunit|nr:3-isopropylmalate dehydratase large subunit [Phycisphaerae bacterium]